VITKMLRRRTARMTGVIAVLALSTGVFSAPASADPAPPIFIGLGDSYAAGMGGGLYLTDPPGLPFNCNQTAAGYSRHLPATPSNPANMHLGCAGFTTENVTAVVAGLAANPATQPVLQNASVITVTVGGNDIGAAGATAQCAALRATPDCRKALFDSIAVKLPQLPAKIKAMVSAIKSKAPLARIVLTGYPRLFTINSSMTTVVKSMATTVNAAADLLNATIAVSAVASRVGYVSVTNKFLNHGVGSAQPWIVGLQPLCQLSSTCAPDTQPGDTFHPTATGHISGYAESVKAALTR